MCQREAVQRLPAQQIADFSSRAMEFTKTGEVFMFPPLPETRWVCSLMRRLLLTPSP